MTATNSHFSADDTASAPVRAHAAAPAALPVLKAAEYLGVSKSLLDTWRSRGVGPRYVRLGAKVVYRVAALNEYLMAHEQGGAR